MPMKFERLPELVKPTHYALTLSPDLKNFTFRGQETADIEVSCFVISKVSLIYISFKSIFTKLILSKFQFMYICKHLILW